MSCSNFLYTALFSQYSFYDAQIDFTGNWSTTEGSYFDVAVNFIGSKSLRPLAFGVFGGHGSGGVGITITAHSHITLDGNWGSIAPYVANDYGLNCQAYVAIGAHVPTITGTLNDILIGANAMSWTDTPHKNTLPNQARWTGAAAAAGLDTNDYHVITL